MAFFFATYTHDKILLQNPWDDNDTFTRVSTFSFSNFFFLGFFHDFLFPHFLQNGKVLSWVLNSVVYYRQNWVHRIHSSVMAVVGFNWLHEDPPSQLLARLSMSFLCGWVLQLSSLCSETGPWSCSWLATVQRRLLVDPRKYKTKIKRKLRSFHETLNHISKCSRNRYLRRRVKLAQFTNMLNLLHLPQELFFSVIYPKCQFFNNILAKLQLWVSTTSPSS